MNNKLHVMIDLETLGVERDAVFLSLAAQVFDPRAMSGDWLEVADARLFYKNIELESAMQVRLTISPSTLQWWLTQSPGTMSLMFNAPEELGFVLDSFATFLHRHEVTYLWGNSASFDLGILANAYKATGREVPWKHWNELCYRTVKSLSAVPTKIEFRGAKHNPVDDCRHQILRLQEIFQTNPPVWQI